MRLDRRVVVPCVSALALVVGLLAGDAGGQTQGPALQGGDPKIPLYKPPPRGAPLGRVGGGTRGVSSDTMRVQPLAPDHVGLTIYDQPSLYWYLSSASAAPLEVTVTMARGILPLLDLRLNPPLNPGLYKISLQDLGIRLSPNVEYRWFVSVVRDPEHRSRDILAMAAIRLVDPSTALQTKLREAGPENLAHVYAEEGLWYDALAAVSRAVEAEPATPSAIRQRAALLEQIGLQEIANSERQRAISAKP